MTEIEKKFIEFLNIHHIFEQFKYNVKHYPIEGKKTLKSLFKSCELDPETYINYGFTWSSTLQRPEYWHNMAIKWVDFI